MMHPGPWSKAQAEARLEQVAHLLAECGWCEWDEELLLLQHEQSKLRRLLKEV